MNSRSPPVLALPEAGAHQLETPLVVVRASKTVSGLAVRSRVVWKSWSWAVMVMIVSSRGGPVVPVRSGS
jgi:hypothetical protein